jgi:2-polyprenyl-3-methyl-5-hydroxy-6-metoxy-1,4-benzoquinol methylase
VEQNQFFCPGCGSSSLSFKINVVDHFLTKDSFTIHECLSCKLQFTSSRPSESDISSYYNSEEYVSHSSSNKGFINKIYKRVRNITLRKKVMLLTEVGSKKMVIDIGAGTGHFVKVMKLAGFEATGLEPDADARRVALTENNVVLQDISSLKDIPKSSVDTITMWHVLEHVYHLVKDLEHIHSILKQDGLFVVAVPNHTSYDAKHYQGFWAAYDVPRHLYHFSPDSIKNVVEKCGFSLVSIHPMKFDSFYVCMLSEKYKGGSLLSAFVHGLMSNRRAKGNTYSSQIYVFRKR